MGGRVGMWVRVIALLTRLVDDYTTGRRPGVWVIAMRPASRESCGGGEGWSDVVVVSECGSDVVV